MRSLPKIVQTIALQSPKLNRSAPAYSTFLESLIRLPENKKNILSLRKSDADKIYVQCLRQTFPHDDSIITTLLTEVKLVRKSWRILAHLETFSDRKQMENVNGHKAWESIVEASTKGYRGKVVPSLPADLLQLKLLILHRLASNSKSPKDQISSISYKLFAETVRRQNPNANLTKERMDETFRLAASHLTKSSMGNHAPFVDKMVNRCLGRESSKYWKED